MKRLLLNGTILILFLALMSFQFLPRILHEIFGVAFFAAGILHLYFNRAWFKSLTKGKYDFSRALQTTINFLMIISFVVITITGIFLSNFLFENFVPLELQRNISVHGHHVALPYLMMILAGIHIGLHWKNFFRRFVNFFGVNPDGLKFKIVAGTLAAIIIFVGVYGAFLNRVGDRLLMLHIFGTPAYDLPFAGFVGIIFCGIGIYTLATIFILRFFKK